MQDKEAALEDSKINFEGSIASRGMVTDDAFSTGTRLERAGIAGPVRCLWTSCSSAKTRKNDRRGLVRCLFDA